LLSYRTAKEDGITSGKFLFDSASIIFSKIRPYLNKVALAPSRGLCSADAYALKAREGISTRLYIWFLLRQPDFLKYAETQSNRANIPKLNRYQLLSYMAPAPDLDLQIAFEERLNAVRKNEHQNRRAMRQLDAVCSPSTRGFL
jgi:type I restriction enzyme S subunit